MLVSGLHVTRYGIVCPKNNTNNRMSFTFALKYAFDFFLI